MKLGRKMVFTGKADKRKVTSRSVATEKMKKKMNRSRRLLLNSLPQDLIVEVTVQLASNSSTPLHDVKNLRATCKGLYEATKARKVGKSIAVDKEWGKHWWDSNGYFEFLEHCAKAGNLNASYIIGLEHIHNLNSYSTGLLHLERAVTGGHLPSAYFLGLTLFPNGSTRSLATNLLNKVASGAIVTDDAASESTTSGSPHVDRCRKEALTVLKKISRSSTRKRPPELGAMCKDPLCGRVVTNQWRRPEEIPRSFCGGICRWRHEFYTFTDKV